MGLIGRIFGGLFGGGRNVIAETAGIFRENSEAGAQRTADYKAAALSQFSAEFRHERKGFFDRFMDSLNRLPRPLMVTSIYALFASAMFAPLWFAERIQGLALVPDQLWWMAGTIVVFYFGGRFQLKSQEFHRSAKRTAQMVPQVLKSMEEIREYHPDSPGVADTGTDAELSVETTKQSDNDAVRAWREKG